MARRRIVLLALMAGAAWGEGAPQGQSLGRYGEVAHWLALGHAPANAAPLDLARLTAGAQASGDPAAGQSVALNVAGGAPWTGVWRRAAMTAGREPGVRRDLCFERLRSTGAEPVYLYTRLDSQEARDARLTIGLTETSELWWNGERVWPVAGARIERVNNDLHELRVPLRQGTNRLAARIVDSALFCRLTGERADPSIHTVRIRLDGAADAEPFVRPPRAERSWAEIVASIPPVPAPDDDRHFGAHLGRALRLLESGGATHRPVRLVFYGQSIEFGWTEMLVARLRERYPNSTILVENNAIGGWFVWRLIKSLGHDVLTRQPDLVFFHAYQGTPEIWERLLSNIRRATTADIVIRTSHHSRGADADGKEPPRETSETRMLRHLAAKYDVELVDVGAEWADYLKAHKLPVQHMLADGIHLNQHGAALMAQLYERHFRVNPFAAKADEDPVRRFDVGQGGGIRLVGAGWTVTPGGEAGSASPRDALVFRFKGTRIDAILAAGSGAATVKIDGRSPTEWNLFRGIMPRARVRGGGAIIAELPTYVLGRKLQEETWELEFTHSVIDRSAFRFRLSGSKTGLDGEGDSDTEFASNSGRIRIVPSAWMKPDRRLLAKMAGKLDKKGRPIPPTPPPAFAEPLEDNPDPDRMRKLARGGKLVWYVTPNGLDRVSAMELGLNTGLCDGSPAVYATLADGLPDAEHELTLTPVGGAPFAIRGLEVHRAPLARDPAEVTQ